MTPEQETRLIDAIAATFGDEGFDTTSITCAGAAGVRISNTSCSNFAQTQRQATAGQ
jgi:hypothetical protein